MKKIRTVLALLTVILLMAGYFASQGLRSVGAAPSYTAALDKSSVPYLALALLVAGVVFAFIPDKGDEPQ